MKIDWIVVGAGFTGATAAERLAARGERVLVVDKRPHIAGNAYDERDEDGVWRHVYGPHIFHTNSEKVWTYLQQFSQWRPYFHRVRAVVDGREVPLPVNLDTIEALFPPRMAERYVEALTTRFRYGERVPILKLMKEAEGPLAELASYIYTKVFANYTRKQWDLSPEELSPHVTARVPILVSRDDRYFQDRWQAMPTAGYTALIGKMLASPKIKVLLSTSYQEVRTLFPDARVLYTGPIDEYYDYRLGGLPYRSVHFEWSGHTATTAQTVGTINYPEEYDFTRITEMRHLTGQLSPRTTLVAEYPQTFIPGLNEPYYPIPTDSNLRLYEAYRDIDTPSNAPLFMGRLAEYKYYNMDQAVATALAKTAVI